MTSQHDLSDRVLHYGGLAVRGFVYLMMLTPAVIVIGASFNSGELLKFPPQGFSFRWYAQVWQNQQFMVALWTSAYLAVFATIASLVLGFASAFVLDRFKFPLSSLFASLLLSPIIIPMVVLGLALLQLFSWLGLSQSFTGLFLSHVLIMLPYVVRTLSTGISLINKTLEEAALNLGASPLRTTLRVSLPLLMPSLVAAAVFAFVTSFGNVTLSVFLASASTITLPVQIFAFVESSYDPTVAAVSSIVIAVTLGVILLIEKLVGVSQVVGR
ncbi:ABC transporter permease [Phyllobacterium zundukense]|uniref:ABC transporter permease n=1 Tax=Phyllobacterium zundukense TaxID=1867719 RepID=A0ACD4CVF1_9HYPH|nr:ABC transporter permease [Phyllobacterium zundukense]UXN57580.1 ABC transporter permease [Phyllobacterium zundukense]